MDFLLLFAIFNHLGGVRMEQTDMAELRNDILLWNIRVYVKIVKYGQLNIEIIVSNWKMSKFMCFWHKKS